MMVVDAWFNTPSRQFVGRLPDHVGTVLSFLVLLFLVGH